MANKEKKKKRKKENEKIRLIEKKKKKGNSSLPVYLPIIKTQNTFPFTQSLQKTVWFEEFHMGSQFNYLFSPT